MNFICTAQEFLDLRLSPEVYNQLRVLQKKAKELRTDVRNLRKTSQANALTMKDLLRDTVAKITSVLQSGEASWMQGSGDAERAKIQREEASYRQDMNKLDKDLCDLELKVEELRNNVINRRLRVNMSDVENMALILSRSSKTVADLKAKFPILQDGLKGLISAEMERAICNEKFLKEEPDKLESALRRCKKLTGTLVTLKRLASVQEQRVPPGLLPGVLVANGDPRAPSPPPSEDPRAAAIKVCVDPLPHHAHSHTLGRPSRTRPISVNAKSDLPLTSSSHTLPRPRSTSAHARSSFLSNHPTPAAVKNNSPTNSKATRQMVNSKPVLTAKPNIVKHTQSLNMYTSPNSTFYIKANEQALDYTPEREVISSKPKKKDIVLESDKTPMLDNNYCSPPPEKTTPVQNSAKSTVLSTSSTSTSNTSLDTPTPTPVPSTRSRTLLSRKRTPTSL
ncbi:hypothetical protein Pmani_023361 [Petrolisthes manimaculis]|uniref:Actin interacting protein 3-like C-terminal domain-containing protein n=1 Tax=Petrolisthes manimaculis TaxID=1843537 RepID=A0AAE1PA82_9EUCA|nr:hypothetical protein Pmani_023361 [Petrolisthes manimaculis]